MKNQRQFTKVNLGSHYFCVAMAEQRAKMGISFRELAKKLGTSSRTYLNEVEKGDVMVSMELGLIICQLLDIPFYFLTDYINKGNQQRINRASDAQYIEWLQSVPEEVIGQVLNNEESLKTHFDIIERVAKDYEYNNSVYKVL